MAGDAATGVAIERQFDMRRGSSSAVSKILQLLIVTIGPDNLIRRVLDDGAKLLLPGVKQSLTLIVFNVRFPQGLVATPELLDRFLEHVARAAATLRRSFVLRSANKITPDDITKVSSRGISFMSIRKNKREKPKTESAGARGPASSRRTMR